MLQKGGFMKNIFESKGRFILYSLFAVAVLSFAVLLLFSILLHENISPFALIVSFMCIMVLSGIIIQKRSGPPW